MLGSPVNILNVENRGQFIHFIFLFYGIGINIFVLAIFWYLVCMHCDDFITFHYLYCLQANGWNCWQCSLFFYVTEPENQLQRKFDKINMFIFPKLGKQYYIWKMYAEFKLSKELSVVYFLSQLPKHYQEYENRIVVFINPDTSLLKSNSISIWTSKLPFPSIKTLSNIELGKSFKNKFT